MLPGKNRIPESPRKAWCDGVIELHRNDEGDAPVRVDDTEEGAEGIQPLRNHNATADGRRHFGRDVVLHQSQSRSASPAKIQRETQAKNIQPVREQGNSILCEFGEQSGGEGCDRYEKEEGEVDPRKAAVGALEMIELR